MATALKAPDVVGVTEVASMAGVSRKTVSSWLSRGSHGMPPATQLAAGPVWSRRQIEAWLTRRATARYIPNHCSDCAELGAACGR